MSILSSFILYHDCGYTLATCAHFKKVIYNTTLYAVYTHTKYMYIGHGHKQDWNTLWCGAVLACYKNSPLSFDSSLNFGAIWVT